MTVQAQNNYLDYLKDLRFQGVNRIFVFLLPFENSAHRTARKDYYLPKIMLILSLMVGTCLINLFLEMAQEHIKNIRNIATGQGDSSVKWGLLACNEVGLFQIFNHVKTIKNH